MIKELTCIQCPMGCFLQVEMEGSKILSVSGNTCPRGAIYARNEVTHPVRMITSTLPIKHGKEALVSCKTKEPVAKGKIFEVMHAMKGVVIEAPIQIGDVLIANIAQTGVDLVATKNVEAS